MTPSTVKQSLAKEVTPVSQSGKFQEDPKAIIIELLSDSWLLRGYHIWLMKQRIKMYIVKTQLEDSAPSVNKVAEGMLPCSVVTIMRIFDKKESKNYHKRFMERSVLAVGAYTNHECD